MTKFDQLASESASKSMSNSHTVNIKLQKYYWEWKSESIDQKRSTERCNSQYQKKNDHKLHKKQINKEAKAQWLKAWNSSIKKKNQYWKHILKVNLKQKLFRKSINWYISSLFRSWKWNMITSKAIYKIKDLCNMLMFIHYIVLIYLLDINDDSLSFRKLQVQLII